MGRPPQERVALARWIQYTVMRPDVTAEQIATHCRECVRYGFHAAMVPGTWVELTARLLSGSGVRVASAIDFPMGMATTAGRVAEARSLVSLGAQELDVMINLGYVKSGLFDAFREDLSAIVRAAAPAEVKVMLELPLLDADESERVVTEAIAAGVHWLKNASGGAVGTATPEQIRFLKDRVRAGVRVKASGGIKTSEQVRALIAAGAELVGTSAGPAIVDATKTPSADRY
jgi:deoxyribose-phosphate aldolase